MTSIQELSRELGIGVDTLRAWERRYGWPQPRRDGRGRRIYSASQRDELRLVRRLIDFGERPGKVLRLEPAGRLRLLQEHLAAAGPDDETLRSLVLDAPAAALADDLRHRLERQGLEVFIHRTAVPLIDLLGRAWSAGEIGIGREHLVSDALEDLLRGELVQTAVSQDAPGILSVIINPERHRLGLLLASLLLQHNGCGVQLIREPLPLEDVPDLAASLPADAVALSFSRQTPRTTALKVLVELRDRLDPRVRMIAGGGALDNVSGVPNVHICCDLAEIGTFAARLQQARSQH
ncbi:MAG: HTH-type transcriptional repressor CarH [Geothermobacteraceae bacterium]